MKKRIISLLLVVSMVLSLLPVSALAAGTKDTAADSPFTDVKPGTGAMTRCCTPKPTAFSAAPARPRSVPTAL